ncbi:MAG: hypothetical protein HY328_14390 [Chloroflexi bacterium]|nr:hypothetical protein [Chloroflexota bacterium]
MGALFYRLTHHEFAGLHFLRWLEVDLFVLGGAAALSWIPGGWLTAGVALALIVGLIAGQRYWQARDFVEFLPAEMPLVTPAILPSSAKLPVWASGYFSVENKHQHFTWLQGFFRTFPSREHAVICLNQPTAFLRLGQSAAGQSGMWYCFFRPETVKEVHWGEIRFGSESLPGLVVAHTVHLPRRNWLQPEKEVRKFIYLACPNREDALAILADLLYDRYAAEAAGRRSLNGVVKKHPQDTWRTLHG